MKLWKMLPLMGMAASLFIFGGCTGMKKIGEVTAKDGTVLEAFAVWDKDPLAQNNEMLIVHKQVPSIPHPDFSVGENRTVTYTQQATGEGFINNLGPAAVYGGAMVWAASELEPDQTNINNSNEGSSASSEVGDVNARSNTEVDVDQKQGQSQYQAQNQEQSQTQRNNTRVPKPVPKNINSKPAPSPKGQPVKDIKETPPPPKKWKKKD